MVNTNLCSRDSIDWSSCLLSSAICYDQCASFKRHLWACSMPGLLIARMNLMHRLKMHKIPVYLVLCLRIGWNNTDKPGSSQWHMVNIKIANVSLSASETTMTNMGEYITLIYDLRSGNMINFPYHISSSHRNTNVCDNPKNNHFLDTRSNAIIWSAWSWYRCFLIYVLLR